MNAFLKPPITGAALSHCRACGFSITLLDANTPKRHTVIRRFLAVVGRRTAEVHS
jgi:hypothetical protein